ncbi:retron system putative HNH endonuclease [Bacillus thuringiensis]|uniref:Retron system putative HNH endonuclease n=1 Tax=Bacillus thuringiensis TaxID=1428 RepID=A0AAW9GCD3_BACTU|nr:retron system putative HNH endonuclease [Bacillus thuringiensis]MDY0850431.1 retron system putative HNH endonuclease [Bacillus thuringiensis]MDY4389212.1 retron system putative HNH endonuclease [Bacillus thuringiensis]
MIYIQRGKEPKALNLNNNKSTGYKELLQAKKHFLTNNQDFKFRAYKATGVKDELNNMFKGKCCYCETDITSATHGDIEHFRPKGAIEIYPKKLSYPGYYWLAMDWNNLLLSCRICNANHKGNKFPLVNESRRIKGPLDKNEEEVLLLNPCEDNPDDHLIFTNLGHVIIKDNSPKGKASIETYGLYRAPLTKARAKVAKEIELKMVHIINGLNTLEVIVKYQEDPDIKKQIKENIQEILISYKFILDKINNPGEPYIAMARQITVSFLTKYEMILNELKEKFNQEYVLR